jgi:hypothetical protein
MNAMLRNNRWQNRWVVRISFALVLLMVVLGYWYATAVWIPRFDNVDLSAFTDSATLTDRIADAGEQAIQVLLGVTSGR